MRNRGGHTDEANPQSQRPFPGVRVDPHPPFCSYPPRFRANPQSLADQWRDDVGERRARAVQARLHRAEVDAR